MITAAVLIVIAAMAASYINSVEKARSAALTRRGKYAEAQVFLDLANPPDQVRH